MADRLEDVPCTVEIDAVALLEIRLGLAGDDGSEIENDVGAGGETAGDGAGIGDV